jgi:2-C-methyl-D-erythritol 2,4-cyclodiphosphate synthase
VTAVIALLEQRGWRVVNADLTLIAEAPRIGEHREAIGRQVAQLLGIAPDAVNLKATTTERLGFIGRGEGLAAQATVLLAAVG